MKRASHWRVTTRYYQRTVLILCVNGSRYSTAYRTPLLVFPAYIVMDHDDAFRFVSFFCSSIDYSQKVTGRRHIHIWLAAPAMQMKVTEDIQ